MKATITKIEKDKEWGTIEITATISQKQTAYSSDSEEVKNQKKKENEDIDKLHLGLIEIKQMTS